MWKKNMAEKNSEPEKGEPNLRRKKREFSIWSFSSDYDILEEDAKRRERSRTIEYGFIEKGVEIAASKNFKSIEELAKEIVRIKVEEMPGSLTSITIYNVGSVADHRPHLEYKNNQSVSLDESNGRYTLYESGKLSEKEIRELKKEIIIRLKKRLNKK